MWGALAVGAFFTAFQPVRLAIVALVISRPRPLANLLAYWVGAVVFGIPSILIPLFVLHTTPTIESFTDGLSTSTTFKHVQVGIGVFALVMATLLLARATSRQKAVLSSGIGASTLVVEDSDPSPAFLQSDDTADTAGRSPIQRLFGYARKEWENGALWVACLVGMSTGGPSLDGIVLGTALIVTSGATPGTQVVAALAFVFGMLMVVETILLSSVIAPVKTRAILQLVHDWVQLHRRKILIVSFTLIGIVMLAQGLSSG